jgi:hypothetical protein
MGAAASGPALPGTRATGHPRYRFSCHGLNTGSVCDSVNSVRVALYGIYAVESHSHGMLRCGWWDWKWLAG